MMSQYHKDEILSSIVRQIFSVASPDKIILFGSRAKGMNGYESDYDICVLKRGIKKKRVIAQKIYRGLSVLASVDVMVNTPDGFERNKENPFLIYREIDRSGIVVYEKRITDN